MFIHSTLRQKDPKRSTISLGIHLSWRELGGKVTTNQ